MTTATHPQLFTSRLLLREPLLTDAPAIQILRSDKTVNKYLNRPEKTSLQEAELFLENVRSGMNAGEAYYWIITPASLPGKVMGTISSGT